MTEMIQVRKGGQQDLPAVYRLVKELAVYEKAGDEVSTSIADYERDLASGWFEVLIAEDEDNQVVGMMLYHRAYSTWKGRMLYLEDFVVDQQKRRLGIGQKLWSALTKVAAALECTSIKWQVLDWNTPAKEFYLKVGAELDPEWENGRLWL